jgi:SulP family sulfate permease
MAALVAIMIMVSIGTFDWSSFKNLKTLPLSTNIVMLTTVAVTVYTHNLAHGVFAGVLLASLFFANKISHFMYCETLYSEDNTIKTYKFVGQVFFNSADKFYKTFDFKEVVDKVVIDLTRAHFWDISAVYALDKAVIKLRREGTEVEVIGQNEASSTIIDRFGVHDKPEEIEKVMGGH